jgi:predicted dehydrogenase
MMKNGRIGVGILGVHHERGWAIAAHVPALNALPDFEIVALSNTDLAAARETARKLGVPHAFADHTSLLACADVELVVVTVKVPYHFALVKAALQAGKAVFCEWPLANGMSETAELERLARESRLFTAIGLQSRAAPEIAAMRDLVQSGHIGEVLSASLLGSGVIGGATIPAAFAYTLDPKNGAGILNVAFAHAIDTLTYVIGSPFNDVSAILANRRHSATVVETGTVIPMLTPDQIAISGRLESGPVVTAHVRGGLSRGQNFRLEVNGSRGDLLLTSTLGYPGIGDTTLSAGADEDVQLQVVELPVPVVVGPSGMARNVYFNYAQLARDWFDGTHTVPTFTDALRLQHLISTIEDAALAGSIQHLGGREAYVHSS